METTRTYKWCARRCTEYDINNGWEYNDFPVYGDSFTSIKEARANREAFIDELDIPSYEVYCIELLECDEDDNLVDGLDYDIIDNSPILKPYHLMLVQYYGQYMIPSGRYELMYVSNHCTTENELLTRYESSSFKWHPDMVFYSDEDAIDYIINNGLNVTKSVIELEETEEN